MTLLPSHLAQSSLGEKCAFYLDSVAGNVPVSLHTLRHRVVTTLLSVKSSNLLHSLTTHPLDSNHPLIADKAALILTVIACVLALAAMSWRSPFTNLWRRNAPAPPHVSDNSYSYITDDDVYNRPSKAYGDQYNEGGDAEPDILLLKHRKTTYPLHFAAYAIDDEILSVGHLRQRAAEATQTSNPNRIKLLYKGNLLNDDARSCKSEGLKQHSEVLCVVSEVQPGERTPSEGSDVEKSDSIPEGAKKPAKKSKNKNKNKNRKNKNKKDESSSAAPSPAPSPAPPPKPIGNSSSLPPPAPNLKAFDSPLDQANALHSYFRSELQGGAEKYVTNTPTEPKARDFEHKKWSETILAQVILKADGIDVTGNEDARAARRALVKEAQTMLNQLDQAVKE
ncbi:hypothetical protein ASPWEDRAFT_107868 [Aspergillus wentii DTO 134E9]|uniref:BAG domain-containing protein n=1 Tax=Aspergillus wentii DTO 134E9 TaxID=1073089 RepID=A0A1L9RNU3_ASPWE|nr:uncharacterized protein ASPWEDRAFT_107868 [Aspergillus wentii DTO 134E9]KAI9934241.1 hypothetical protein MW887_005315 [Aspergillus wentii]OJJ36619.1 hypothetical protein ASPWEDRAFT_107868 [Aspergillus wentii DTO 134E9]